MSNDFKVEQTYDELGEACFNAVYSALIPYIYFDEPPTDSEMEWAEKVAEQATNSFLMHLDSAE